MISIIMPIYNVKDYLDAAVDSVISQTYTDWELIAVDDGSSDGSEKKIDDWASRDARIRVFHTKNRGLSAARNFGLKNMSGEFVQFLDSDDWFAPTLLEEAVSAIKEPDVDMVIFDAYIEGMGMNYHEQSPIPSGIYDSRVILKLLAQPAIPPNVWNKFCRSSLYRDVAFPEGEEWEDVGTTFYPVSRARKIAVLAKPLYYYRQRTDSITKKSAMDNSIYKWRFIQYRKRYEFLKQHDPEIAEVAKTSLVNFGIRYYTYCGKRETRREVHRYLCSQDFNHGITNKKLSVLHAVFAPFPHFVSLYIKVRRFKWRSRSRKGA